MNNHFEAYAVEHEMLAAGSPGADTPRNPDTRSPINGKTNG